MNKKAVYRVLIFSVFIIGIVLRLYRLGEIPTAMQQDETSLGYNAFSIAQTLRDEHGAFLPQNFRAFGEYKLPGYIYASVIPVLVFGYSAFSVRFVSATTGILMLVVSYFLARRFADILLKRKDARAACGLSVFPLIVLAHLALNPWHLNFSRAAFEAMMSAAFVSLGTLLFIQGVRKNSAGLMAGAMAAFSVSVYTYNIARLFTPLFVAWLFIVYSAGREPVTHKLKITGFILFILLMLPFLMGALTRGGFGSTTGTLILTSAAVQSQLLELRSYFSHWDPVVAKIFFNKFVLTGWFYVNNVVKHISPEFFFVNGGIHGNTSIGTSGHFYVFELPLFVIGLHMLLTKYDRATLTLIGYVLLVILTAALTREAPQSTRSFLLVLPITIIISYGTVYFYDFVRNLKKPPVRAMIGGVSVVSALFYVAFYFSSYYGRAPVYYARHWRTADRDVALFLRENAGQYSSVIFDYKSGYMYTSLLSYLPYPPADFQSQAVRSAPDSEGFTHPVKFGKYEFRDIDWTSDMTRGNTLIITTYDRVPQGIAVFRTFPYPTRPVVLNIGQDISWYPVTEPAYVIIKTNP